MVGTRTATCLPSVAALKAARTAMSDVWYTINGVKLDGKPTAKGLYIVNGKKTVIK